MMLLCFIGKRGDIIEGVIVMFDGVVVIRVVKIVMKC